MPKASARVELPAWSTDPLRPSAGSCAAIEDCGGYSARVAQQQMQARRQACRPVRKLLPGSERFELVAHMLRERLSPGQIAGKLRSMNIPSLKDAYVCRETIYNAIYALPVGELRKELIICLRQSKTSAGRALAAWIGAARSPRWSAFMCARRRSKIG